MVTKSEIKQMVKEEFHNEKNIVTISLMTWGQEFEKTLDAKMRDLYDKLDSVKAEVAQTTFAIKEHDEMKKSIQEMVSKTWFYWIIGGLSVVFGVALGVMWNEIKTDRKDNTDQINSARIEISETKNLVKEIQWTLNNKFTN